MIKVLAINAQASIQDLGRYGLRRLGIGHAGAMDRLALQAGNLLLGNPESAAAIEVALGGITLEFTQDCAFCLTGAFYLAELNGEIIYSYWRYYAKAGQVLQLVRAVEGMYGYICLQGGIDVPEVLGSRSTDLKAGFGGFQGRALRVDDQLSTFCNGKKLSCVGIAPIKMTHYIHALPSSEYAYFTRNSHYHFWHNPWVLQSNSNRMGYRIQGDSLELNEPLEMLSHAVQFGTIQVPPSGQPIILMADTQTTGGYPKIACVSQADLGRIAQIRLGTAIYFQAIDLQQANALRQKDQIYLNQIKRIADEN
ncbi:MAG: biotin-dependent carboxyltransferase family protein [Pasteurellaceae bacterium]|nr:biotin-dependent carboxyltransferase family protein [Pasteurellaceae bacterium]